jgi:competence protein ComEA
MGVAVGALVLYSARLQGDPPDPAGLAGTSEEAGSGVVVEALEGEPAAAQGVDGGTVVVHVTGAVAAPGVVELPTGARVGEAVDAAGGAMADADLGAINLARVLVDAEQVVVPREGEALPAAEAAEGATAQAGGSAGNLVDINQATQTDLQTLPGIGPVLAARIVAHREANGPFPDVESLGDVVGIGPAILGNVRAMVTAS